MVQKINSKNKGNSAERDLCKIFGDIFKGSFIRTSSSGAFIGGNNKFRKQQLSNTQIRSHKSDIIPPDDLSKLVIECKFYKDFPFYNLISGNVKILNTWLEQLNNDCNDDDIGFLCFKINNKGWFIVFKKELQKDTIINNHFVYNEYIITDLITYLNNNVMKLSEMLR